MGIKYSVLNQDKFIKKYNLQEITDPILLSTNGVPTENGLLSDKIFGVTPKDRSNTFAFIRLNEVFLHPMIYDQLIRYNKKFLEVISCQNKFIIKNGEIERDENGNNGLSWLINNFKSLEFNKTHSVEKKILSKSLTSYQKQNYLMDKLIVIPAFYRDIDTSKGFISVGEINQLYINVIRQSNIIKNSDKYYMSLKNDSMYKMQTLLLQVMNYFMDEKYDGGSGDTLLGKEGAIYRTSLRKTIKYSSRLVLSQANNEANHWSEIPVTLDTMLLPLDSAASQLFPFVIFNIKNLIHNRYKSGDIIECLDKNNKKVSVTLKELEYEYDDENIKKYVNRFIKSIGNRFEPVKAYNEESKDVYFIFKYTDKDNNLIERRLTWTDIIYLATVEAAEKKYTLSTRFPLDTAFNQIIHKMKVGSTNETIKIRIRGTTYDNYPKIDVDEVGSNTENKFRQTCNISNCGVATMGGDFDGDTVSNKTPFSDEANFECEEFIKSKKRSINMSGKLIYGIDNEAILSGYTLTKCYNEDKLSEPLF